MQKQETEREYIRKAKKQIEDNRKYLQDLVAKFLTDACNKGEKEIKELYTRYDSYWMDYCKQKNAKATNHATVFEDAFEASVQNGSKVIKVKEKEWSADFFKKLNAMGDFDEVAMYSVELNEEYYKKKAEFREYKRVFGILKHRSKVQEFFYRLGKFIVKDYKPQTDKRLPVIDKKEIEKYESKLRVVPNEYDEES